jgi:hypothetical protein
MRFPDAVETTADCARADGATLGLQKSADSIHARRERREALAVRPFFEGLDIGVVAAHCRGGVGSLEASELGAPVKNPYVVHA